MWQERKGFTQIVAEKEEKGFSQIVADNDADLRRFLMEECLNGEYLEVW